MAKGRPRQFDEQQALDQATLVFWRKGYRGTSLDDLTEAMNINRPSLYSSFGDKERLFLLAVEQYRRSYIMPAVLKLMEAGELRPGLEQFFSTIQEIVVGSKKGTPPGCFIACVLTEDCCESEVIRTRLADLIQGADAAFTSVFDKHKRDLVPHISPAAAGKFLTTTLHGLAIRARAQAPKLELMEIARAFIDCTCK